MPPKLVLGPAASSKTRYSIYCVMETLRTSPFAQVWVVVPDSHQAIAFRRRVAEQGGALGAHIGTFADLHAEILARAGTPFPVSGDPVVRRIARAAIDRVASQERLRHYGSIKHQPGLADALTRLIAELKLARIEPERFSNAVKGRGRRLEELAFLFSEYQDALVRLQWADVAGLGWLAVQALQSNDALGSDWKLLIADGFDSFFPLQLETLKLLAPRAGETIVTLTGDMKMQRRAYRRFKRTFDQVESALQPEIEPLIRDKIRAAPLLHLEESLFESIPNKINPERAVSFIEAQTQALEAREALRWIKARIQRDRVPAHECAIIARDLTPYRTFLRDIGKEFGIPLRFANGEPLASNPAISALFNLLELKQNNWQRRPLLDALRAPYFSLAQFQLASADAFRFDHVARWGQIVAGLEQWKETFTRLEQHPPREVEPESEDAARAPALPRGEQARARWSSLEKFAERVTPPERATLVEFVEWIENLLSAQQGLGVLEQAEAQSDTAERDRAALIAFQDALRALVLSEKIVGERDDVTFADFLADLRGAVDAATYVPEDSRTHTQSRIYCAGINQARGVPYRAVAVIGLSEGLFPSPVDEDPFLSDDDREKLSVQNVSLEPRSRSDQQTLFYEAVTRASEFLLLTRPSLAEDGEKWEASPYWNRVRALFNLPEPRRARAEDSRALADCASKVELLTVAVRNRGLPKKFSTDLKADWENLRHTGSILRARLGGEEPNAFDGHLPALRPLLKERYGAEQVWSASALETYAACGFRFLFDHALKLEERKIPEEGFDAAQLGEMLHAIFENVYRSVADPTDLDTVLSMLPLIAHKIFENAPAAYGFRPDLLWDKRRAEYLASLTESIRALADEEEGMRPVHFEETFGAPPLSLDTPAGAILFRGRIDRIDADTNRKLRVIDYKTGTSALDPRSLGEGLRIQLIVYALGAERALSLGKVEDGFYWSILKGQPSSLRLAKFKFTDEEGKEYDGLRDAIALTKKNIAENVRGIRAGDFAPLPPRDGCPEYCVAKSICWQYKPAARRS